MFGTGGNAIGDTSAITAALQRRRLGDSVSPLSQVSGSSPGFQGAQPPQPGQGNVMGMNNPLAQKGGGGGMSPDSAESQIIVKALRDRLSHLGKVETGGGMGGI